MAEACVPGRASEDFPFFDGAKRLATTIPGGTLGYVGSNLYEYSPYVAPTGYGAEPTASAWVMLENDAMDPETPFLWASIGWLKTYPNTRHLFWEWTDSVGNWYTETRLAWPVGGSTYYEVLWDDFTQQLNFYANYQLYDSKTRYFTMRRANVSGETHNRASQMPGGTSKHQTFLQSQVANLDGSVFSFGGTSVVTDPSIHANSHPTARAWHIWDTACAT